MKTCVLTVLLLAIATSKAWTRGHVVTNVAQFAMLSERNYLEGCDFRLSGVVTLVDPTRELTVVQDATGAVALSIPTEWHGLEAGEFVSLEGFNCRPTITRFPSFPHRPTTSDIRTSFEAPINSGNYHLTRMRGWLRPPVDGEYTFWIASDNSSELWLSGDDRPGGAKRIAQVSRFEWVASREWSKFPSQRSEPVRLEADRSYYIEAIHEQSVGDANLAVAWQGPTLEREVVSGTHLSPWKDGRGRSPSVTEGILHETWTSFYGGNLSGLPGPGPYESALSVERLRVIARGVGELPQPRRLDFDEAWMAANNYRWVATEGAVTFAAEAGDRATLRISGSTNEVELRTPAGGGALAQLMRNTRVRVEGVCETVFNGADTAVPGLIWVPRTNDVFILEQPAVGSVAAPVEPTPDLVAPRAPIVMEGYYGTRGVVTFNDHVFGQNLLFVQEGNTAVFINLEDRGAAEQLQVGEWVELGGALQRGDHAPMLTPMVVTRLGWHAMPEAIVEPIETPVPGNRDGRWTESLGVVQSVNTDGTVTVMGADEPLLVWMGGTDRDGLSQYVDANLRARGVLSLTSLDGPVLLVPSLSYVEIVAAAPADPFGIPRRAIATLRRDSANPASNHRVRVAGEVTLKNGRALLIQDATGSVRVELSDDHTFDVGDPVEVIGFPQTRGPLPVLARVLSRAADGIDRVMPAKLDLAATPPVRQLGDLVSVEADLIAQQVINGNQVLELQERQRIFTATLSAEQPPLATIEPGSRVRVTGVCNGENALRLGGEGPRVRFTVASLNLLVRSPGDVRVLYGPPWWTLRRVGLLIGALFIVSTGALLWVHLLRRRLARQKAAQLVFSQQLLKHLEDERRRIAANLHDSLGQVLLAIKNQALLAMQHAPGDAAVRERLREISGTSSQTLEEVRQITHGLRPYQLDRLGLTHALRSTVHAGSANGGISFASRVEDVDSVFDKDSEIHVYRIVQEAINNVLKHAAATEAAVVIKRRSGRVSLSIRDNGRGFDVHSIRFSQPHDLGYGLSGIAERVRILGGHLSIDSRPDGGTSLNVDIPIHHANGNNSHNRR